MDFQSDYATLTKKIDDTLTTQVSSSLTWDNVPGTFDDDVVSSSGGYAWSQLKSGDNGIAVYKCELPCTGNWVKADMKGFEKYQVSRIAIDDINVYIALMKRNGINVHVEIISNIVSGKGEWTTIYSGTTNANIINLLSTRNFLWLVEYDQANPIIRKCPKPCMPGNWMIQSNPEKVILASSTETELYGINGTNGKHVKTDENMRTGWHVIKAFENNKDLQYAMPVGADPQRTGMYAVTANGKLLNCKGNCEKPNDIVPMDTKNLGVAGLTYDSGSKKLWMMTTNPGEKGNIFTQVDKPDFTSISNAIDPLDKKRDEIVKNKTKEYVHQTKTLTTNKQIQTVVDFFQKFFGYSNSVKKQNESQSSALSDTIQKSQQEIDKKLSVTSQVIILVITLAIVAVIYVLFEPVMGALTHFLAAIALIGGIFFAINKNV